MKLSIVSKAVRLLTSTMLLAVGVSFVANVSTKLMAADCTPPPSGLVGWWRGEGNTVDEVYGNDGVLVNSNYVHYTNGVVGEAFDIGPVPYGVYGAVVSVPDIPAYQLTNSLSIEAWVKPLGTGAKILERGDSRPGMDPYGLSMEEANEFQFQITDPTGASARVVYHQVNYGQWYYIVATLDGNSGAMKLYVNGNLVAQTNTTIRPMGPLIASDNPGIGIGNCHYDGINNFPFDGIIDEVSLYNRALSSNEVAAIYAAGSAGKCLGASACAPPPSGLAGWWPAEGNADDVVSGNNGTLMNGAGFMSGEVGQAFNLIGANQFVLINPKNSGLDVGSGSGLTIEGWIYPTTLSSDAVLVEYERQLSTYSASDVGVQFGFNANPNIGWSPGALAGNLKDTSNHDHALASAPYMATTNVWQHVAETYDRASGIATLYLNGVVVAQTNFGSFIPQTSFTNVLIGARTTFGSVSSPRSHFYGGMDEFSIYNCALSSNEIATIYAAGGAGKCRPSGITAYIVPFGTVGNQILPVSQTQSLGNDFDVQSPIVIKSLGVFDSGGNGLVGTLVARIYNRDTKESVASLVFTSADPGVLIGGSHFKDLPTPLILPAGFHGVCSVAYLGTTALEPDGNLRVGPGDWTTNDGGGLISFVGMGRHSYMGTGDTYPNIVDPAPAPNNFAAGTFTFAAAPVCTPPPSGLVSWWPGEGSANDVMGINNGVLENGTYTAGEVGEAFALVGMNTYVYVPASPSLNVGLSGGMTIEGWIKPTVLNTERPVADWDNGSTWGVQFNISSPYIPGSGPSGAGPGCLYANLRDVNGTFHWLSSAGGLIQPNEYQYVALTYDKSSGVATIYLNGVVVAQKDVGTFTPQTSYDLYFGTYISNPPQDSQWAGLDEMSLYNRALSAAEIQAIYNARGTGKCPLPPTVLNMTPPSWYVNEGTTVAYTVTAAGSPPLAYQWQYEGTNIADATNSTLTLSNVVYAQAGNYSITVSNLTGMMAISNVTLRVNRAPIADASATEKLLISPNNTNAIAVLDGSRSSDPDGDTLTYAWFHAGDATPFATMVVAMATLPVGTNQLTLTVNDGMASDSQSFAIEVITISQAVDRLSALVESGSGNTQPLVVSLNAALAAIGRNQPQAAINQLGAFINKVQAQLESSDPALAAQLIADAQAIIDALNGGSAVVAATVEISSFSRDNGAKSHLKIKGASGRVYVVETSTNMIDWVPIGVATKASNGEYDFDDTQSQKTGVHFYRVVSP